MLLEAEEVIQLQGKLAGHASAAGILAEGPARVLTLLQSHISPY
jgi:hypothetical protein